MRRLRSPSLLACPDVNRSQDHQHDGGEKKSLPNQRSCFTQPSRTLPNGNVINGSCVRFFAEPVSPMRHFLSKQEPIRA